MKCDLARLALSADLDGEPSPIPLDAVHRHVASCADCRRWSQGAARLRQATRVMPAADVPDLTASILARLGRPPDSRRHWRLALAVVGLVQLAFSLPSLLWAADPGASTHVAHELGSWDVALAVGFLFAAWRPARAWGMVPLVAALAVCLLGTTSIDLADGHARLAHEVTHVLDVVGLACLWPLGRRTRPALRTA